MMGSSTRGSLPLLLLIAVTLAAILGGGVVGADDDDSGGRDGGAHDDGTTMDTDAMFIPPDEQLQLCDPTMETDVYVPDSLQHIDAVHRAGAPHRGVWLFVVDAEERVLLVHRSRRMVTCPNTWSLVGEHNTPGESYEDAARRGLMEELRVSWDDSVKSWFRLEPGPSLLDIHYLRHDGEVHRHDVQWTQSFVVELAKGTEVTLDDENRDYALVPLHNINLWLASHDTCALANVERRKTSSGSGGGGGGGGGGGDDFTSSPTLSFERGTLGELKADSLRRVREALLARREGTTRGGRGGGSGDDGEL